MVNTQKNDLATPLQEGEFRRINGIAAATEEALHRSGIETFAHLATLTPEEIAVALPRLVGVKERAARLDWSGQSASFASQLADAEQVVGLEEPGERQHYASFMVVLLIDEEGRVRRTTVTHVQGETKESWGGWDAEHITGWLAAQAGIQTKPEPLPMAKASQEQPAEEKPAPPKVAEHASGISAIRLIYPVSKKALTTLYEDNPFAALVDVDIPSITSQIAGIGAFSSETLYCQATATLRQMGQWNATQTSEVTSEVKPGENLTIEVPLPGLPQGAYHLNIAVRVWDTAAGFEWNGFTEGVMVRSMADTADGVPAIN